MDLKVSTPSVSFSDGFRQAIALLSMLRPYLGRFMSGLFIQSTAQLIALAPPLLTKQVFDVAVPTADERLLVVLVVAVAIVGLATVILHFLRTYQNQITSTLVNGDLALRMLAHVLHVDVSVVGRFQTGDLVARFGDLQRAIGQVLGIVQTLVLNGVMLLVAPVILLLLNWKLALLSLITLPVTALLTFAAGRIGRRLARRALDATSVVTSLQYEAVAALRLIRTQSAEAQVLATAADRTATSQRFSLESQLLYTGVGGANGMVAVAGTTIFNWFAWRAVLHEEMTTGAFIAFSAYITMLTGPITQLVGLVDLLQQAMASLSRVFEIVDAPTESKALEEVARLAEQPAGPARSITFKSVSFQYTVDRPILTDVSFHIPERTIAVIVGPSGSGKSSIARLINRLYAPTGGSILIDGLPLTAESIPQTRQKVSVAWQESMFLTDSIRNNLLLGTPNVGDDEIWEVLQAVSMNDFVRGLPGGLNAMITGSANALSSGQRQRLHIARALLKRSGVLILDEATANLDNDTERVVLANLVARRSQRTTLLITHRASVAALGEQILFVHGGGVLTGTSHTELLAANEAYRVFWREQGAPSMLDSAPQR